MLYSKIIKVCSFMLCIFLLNSCSFIKPNQNHNVYIKPINTAKGMQLYNKLLLYYPDTYQSDDTHYIVTINIRPFKEYEFGFDERNKITITTDIKIENLINNTEYNNSIIIRSLYNVGTNPIAGYQNEDTTINKMIDHIAKELYLIISLRSSKKL